MVWAQRWRNVLAIDPTAERRLEQGRAWDRSGRVAQVRALPGVLQGRVQGSSATPFAVEIRVPTFDDATWQQVYDALASRARHHAHLLAGQAPAGLEDQLADRGIDLFPRVGELDTDCPCGQRDWPCVHVAAVWESAGGRLNDDPFLLFQLRGRGRQELMADLAERRRGDEDTGGLALGELSPAGWTRPRATLRDIPLPAGDPPATPAPLLRLLGDPPGWEGRVSAWELFAPLIAAAARWERERSG